MRDLAARAATAALAFVARLLPSDDPSPGRARRRDRVRALYVPGIRLLLVIRRAPGALRDLGRRLYLTAEAAHLVGWGPVLRRRVWREM